MTTATPQSDLWDGAAAVTRSHPDSVVLGRDLDELVADVDLLLRDGDVEEIATRSYWHHNGFAKLVFRSDVDRTVRLHVWPAGVRRRGESNPHGHRWCFASAVLCGDGVVQREFAEASAGVAYLRYRYKGRKYPGSLTFVGNTRLAASDPMTVRSGQKYAVDISSVHTIEPRGVDLTATLVVQGPARVESTVVYGRPGRAVDGIDRQTSADDVRRLLGDVRTAVGETRGRP